MASLRTLRDTQGAILDRALVLWFPGPDSSTGEDLAELHLHGGRAVVSAVETTLGSLAELRRATPGEFTRRAFANGRIDLAEAEGLADLLEAETELQRLNAMALAGGLLSRQVEDWRERLLSLSAMVEAQLDFADEDDVSPVPPNFASLASELGREIRTWLGRPRAEALREGFKVVLAGPPNAGKSSLFNALIDQDAAITSEIAGTTRDVLTRTVAIEGVPFQFFDTAGLRDETADPIEFAGIERAQIALDSADLILWLGPEGLGPSGAWEIDPKADLAVHTPKLAARHTVSSVTGLGLADLRRELANTARLALPKPGEVALNRRQSDLLSAAAQALADASSQRDPLLVAEDLRLGRVAFDCLLGRTTTEDMLDALFGRFCIGK
jgi:tRNA modification GTPase